MTLREREQLVIESARNTCDAIEDFRIEKPQVLLSALIQLWQRFDQLYACDIAVNFREPSIEGNFACKFNNPSGDVYFYVVFDPRDKDSLCATSVKDCLSDIFVSLKNGLVTIETDSADTNVVLNEWRIGYETHWGRHLIDVARFLFLEH
jgi:hypothetical protein